MNNTVLCSTGAFIGRVNGRNHKLIMKYAPELHCDGFEFMMYDTWYEKMNEIQNDLHASGLLFPVLHVDKQVGERISRNQSNDTEVALELFKKNCWMANAIGAEKLVLHLWGGIPSDSNISYNIEIFKKLDDIAKDNGLQLTVENVVCNQQNPMIHMTELSNKYSDVVFTFDTKMAAFHNQLNTIYELEWDWLWSNNRIKHLHINDYKGGYMDWSNLKALHIGDGMIDFEKFFLFIKEKMYQGTLTVESTSMIADGSVDIEKLNQSLDYIRTHLNQ